MKKESEASKKRVLAEVISRLAMLDPVSWTDLAEKAFSTFGYYQEQKYQRTDPHIADPQANLIVAQAVELGAWVFCREERQADFRGSRKMRKRIVEAYENGRDLVFTHHQMIKASRLFRGSRQPYSTVSPPSFV